MQNFFRFAPSIPEFEEVAEEEEEDVFFSNDNSSLDINVLRYNT